MLFQETRRRQLAEAAEKRQKEVGFFPPFFLLRPGASPCLHQVLSKQCIDLLGYQIIKSHKTEAEVLYVQQPCNKSNIMKGGLTIC